uniref:Uncharacterized protein n=1 Tax=Arundo donax TaxID=35708 RepID=A0A0A8YWS9_ARUDO
MFMRVLTSIFIATCLNIFNVV